MKCHFLRILISLVFVFSMQAVLAGPPPELEKEVQNSFIFQFSSSVATADMPGLAATLTAKYNGTLRHVFTNAIKGFSATMSRVDAENLVTTEAEVSGLVNNGVAHVPGAGGLGGAQGGKGGKGKPKPTSDGQVESWGVAVVGGSRDASPTDGVTRHAWIIDTGIDDYYSDSELNIGEGMNFVSKGKDTTDDYNGHGTLIAGILAAIDNDTGVLGIAAGATVHPVRVLHNNLWGAVDDIIAGVDYVADRIATYPATDIHVVNMSLTVEIANEPALSALLDTAVNNVANTGIDFAVCAGNDSTDVGLYTPAYLSNENVYTVASIDESISLASDSNYGPQIDYVAPGVMIESLKPGGGTWIWSGCSMATPHVAAILLFQAPTGVENGTGYPLATF